MSAQPEFLAQVVTPGRVIATDRLTAILHITKSELAMATGLSRDAVTKRSRLATRSTRTRLRDTAEIINRVTGWSGSVGRAFAWFRSQPLVSFGDKTAEDLVKEGRTQAVKDYLSRIAEGGFA